MTATKTSTASPKAPSATARRRPSGTRAPGPRAGKARLNALRYGLAPAEIAAAETRAAASAVRSELLAAMGRLTRYRCGAPATGDDGLLPNASKER